MSTGTEKRRIGPFQLESKLGVGGMGIVYKATYLKTGQQVALKVLAPDLSADPKIAKRFEREMDILSKLKHPHIIRYFGGSTSGNQRYYAMELLPGGALDTILRKKKQFTWEETVEYGLQIAKALEHAHNAGVIHRDLKPSNLLLNKEGILKLSDFGIARDTQATQLTAAGKTVGTMAYMAPEQITGKTPITRKTDLYALGCVLFEMLTGRTPFQAETQPELLFKHVEEDPPSVREYNVDVPLWLEQLIDELLAKDPEERPFDALAVQVKLEEVKTKVAKQESIIGQTVAGGGSALTMRDGDPALTKVLGPKKKKRKKKKADHAPVYEQTWFLGLGLLLVIGLIVWAAWPEGEDAIYARIEPVMASTDAGDWFHAEEDLKKLLSKYPEGTHAAKATQWLDDIELERSVRALKTRLARPSYTPETEAERLYVQAKEYERFGDRFAALDVFESMQRVVSDDGAMETRAILALARTDAARIRDEAGPLSDRTDFIQQQLDEADQLYRDGKTQPAREKWRSIIKLYGGKSEFAPLVKQAEARLDNPDSVFTQSKDGEVE